MVWKCGVADHPSWKANANSIISSSRWCAHCYGNVKLTLEYCQQKAAERGGYLLTQEYVNNSHTNMKWKCGVPHHPPWETSANHIINSGSWCPVCKSSKGEREISDILTKYGIQFQPQYNPLFAGTRYYDFYLPTLQTVIEYDGVQHFAVGGIMVKSEGKLQHHHRVDSFKTNIALYNGLNMIRIDYTFLGKIEPLLMICLNMIYNSQLKGYLLLSNSGYPDPVLYQGSTETIPIMYQWHDSTVMKNPGKFEEDQE